MQLTKQEKEYRSLTAETFISLSLGLWTVSLIGYLSSGVSYSTYMLIVIGGLSALLSIYLIVPWNWRQESVLKYFETNQITKSGKVLVWLIVPSIFAINLLKTKISWLIVAGLIILIIAYVFFYTRLWRIEKPEKIRAKKK